LLAEDTAFQVRTYAEVLCALGDWHGLVRTAFRGPQVLVKIALVFILLRYAARPVGTGPSNAASRAPGEVV